MTRFRERLRKFENQDFISEDEPAYPQEEDEYYEEYRPQPQQISYPPQPQEVDNTPLAIAKEVQMNPSPKGVLPTVIGGVPVDLHILEEYLVKVSPYALKTIIRYHNARTIEEIKNYGKSSGFKINSKTIILIVLCIGMAILGILMITVLPDIMNMFAGGGGIV